MTPDELIVASSVSKKAVEACSPVRQDRYVIELRIMTNTHQQQALTALFDRCYAYRVQCTHAANQLISDFWADTDCKEIMQRFTTCKRKHEQAEAYAAYKKLRQQFGLNDSVPFIQKMKPLIKETMPPSHIAERIAYNVYQAASAKLWRCRGKVRYPSKWEFRALASKENGANIQFDPRPKDLEVQIDGQTYPVKPGRTSDFHIRKPELVSAYISGAKTTGHILYCRLHRRLVNNHGQIEWGYWLQLVVQGQLPTRKNTPKPVEQPGVAGLVQKPSYVAAYKEGKCILLLTPKNKEHQDDNARFSDALRYRFNQQRTYATQKSHYHHQVKQLLHEADTLYATPMPAQPTANHQLLWQSLQDIARHTQTQLICLPFDIPKLEAYVPKSPKRPIKPTEKAEADNKPKRQPKPLAYFEPWKCAYLLTCLQQQEKTGGRHLQYQYVIDEHTATRRLIRFRRAMFTASDTYNLTEISKEIQCDSEQPWTAALLSRSKPKNLVKEGSACATPKNDVQEAESTLSCQKELPSSKPQKQTVVLRTPSKRIVEPDITEQGRIRPEQTNVYQQLSSWIVQLPDSIITGQYALSLKALRFFYLMIALAQKQLFQYGDSTHMPGKPYRMLVPSDFLAYCDKGKHDTGKLLTELREVFGNPNAILLTKHKRPKPVRFLEEIVEAPKSEIPEYYLGIRKMYRVTLSAEIMEYLYTSDRMQLPLHVLLECNESYQARLISYFIMRIRRMNKQREPLRTIDVPLKAIVDMLQLPKSMAAPFHGPTLYKQYLQPLLSVIEHYFYLGDVNFMLWCPKEVCDVASLTSSKSIIPLTLQLPPKTFLPEEEYAQLLIDAPFYQQMLSELLFVVKDSQNFDIYEQLSNTEIWKLAEEAPRFAKRIWSTVTRMVWFMGTPQDQDPAENPRGTDTSLRAQLFNELALLKQYTQTEPKS